MDFSRMISDVWALTRRYRSLWLLALFAGLPLGNCGANNLGRVNRGRGSSSGSLDTSSVRQAADDILGWLGDHAGLVTAVAIAAIVLALVRFGIGIVAQGGLTRATLELASGREATLAQAWAAGLATFWQFLRLRLLAGILTVPLAVFGGVVGVLLVRGAGAGGAAFFIGLGGLAGLLVGVPFGVVLSFAMRALVTEEVGAVDAIRAGWRIFRAHIGQSLMVCLINFAFTASIMIAAIVASLLVILPLVGIGIVIGSTLGAPGLIPYLAFTGSLAIAAFLLLGAITSSFSWHFWTLGYLRLCSQMAAGV